MKKLYGRGTRVSLKLKLTLAFVGVVGGLILASPFLYFLLLRDNGTHYSTVGELRSVLNEKEEEIQKGSSVTLRRLIQTDSHDEIIYTLKPNLEVIFQKVPVLTNSFGMRGKEISLVKPEGTYRLALLGDSFAFGWGVEEDKTFARVLEKKLSESLKKPVEVLNFGVPGYSTFQEYAHYVAYGARFSPDAVLVYFVENDWGLPYFLARSDPDNPLMSATDFAREVWNQKTEEAAKERSFYYGIMNPNDALAKLAQFTLAQGTKLFVAVNPGKAWSKDVKRLHVLRRNPGIVHLPLLEPTKKIITERGLSNEELKLPDDPHPNAKKHEILGDILAEGIAQVIGKNF